MNIVLLVLQLLVASVQIPHANPWTISVDGGSGAISATTTEADLRLMYGPENVKNGEIQIGEGEVESGTVVFPDDPLKRIEVLWADPEKRIPKSVYLGGHNAADGDESLWRTTYGITLGTTLLELERINRKPFRLAGFDWDYAGTVLSWNSGVLEGVLGSDARTKVFLRLGYSPGPVPPEHRAVQGDRSFSSGHPAMQKINPHVYQMVFMFHPRS